MKKSLFSTLIILLCTTSLLVGQKRKNKPSSSQASSITYDSAIYNGMEWRCIGPFRGGRSAAVTGVPGKPNLYYFGSTGGGIWKTENGGQTWENISDGYFGGSI